MKSKNKASQNLGLTQQSTLRLLWGPVFNSCVEIMLLISTGAFLALAKKDGFEIYRVWQYLVFATISFSFFILSFVRRIKCTQRLHRRILADYPEPTIKLMFINRRAIFNSILLIVLSVLFWFGFVSLFVFGNDNAAFAVFNCSVLFGVFSSQNYFQQVEKAKPSMNPTQETPVELGEE